MTAASVTLIEHLKALGVEQGLTSILLDLSEVNRRIYDAISLPEMVKGGAVNTTGDIQSSFDVTAEKKIVETLDANDHVCSHLSEECTEFRTCKATGSYFVSYDPYDGGSVGDADITVGSIFGIWSEPPRVGEAVGKHLVCGAYALWGPTLAFAFATKEHGAFWYQYHGGDFVLIGALDFGTTTKQTPIFGPSDIATFAKDPAYEVLFRHLLVDTKLRLRYAGAMVTDVHHVLLRGGCFFYPKSIKKPQGHLRLMYECAPLGFMAIAAGGVAVDASGKSVLDVPIEDWHQRIPVYIGSGDEAIREGSKLFTEIGKEAST